MFFRVRRNRTAELRPSGTIRRPRTVRAGVGPLPVAVRLGRESVERRMRRIAKDAERSYLIEQPHIPECRHEGSLQCILPRFYFEQADFIRPEHHSVDFVKSFGRVGKQQYAFAARQRVAGRPIVFVGDPYSGRRFRLPGRIDPYVPTVRRAAGFQRQRQACRLTDRSQRGGDFSESGDFSRLGDGRPGNEPPAIVRPLSSASVHSGLIGRFFGP